MSCVVGVLPHLPFTSPEYFSTGSKFSFKAPASFDDISTTIEDLHILYTGELVYVFAMAAVKFSILLFYHRLFPFKWFKIELWIIGAVVAAWTIAMEFALAFQCSPVRVAWTPGLDGHCVDLSRLYIGNAIPNIVTDIVIVLVPLPIILKLHVTRAQRLGLYAAFMLGGL